MTFRGLLFLAMSAALSLESFSFDIRHALAADSRMGWQQVMTLHYLSILVAYVLNGALLIAP
jgi:hypothetical protein